MSILNYDVLRTSKAALDEGLIDQKDYDAVKSSFLRAQQIKAGLDAGFIPEAEYTNVKKAFLESLSIGIPLSGGPTSTNHAPGEAQVCCLHSTPHQAVPMGMRVSRGMISVFCRGNSSAERVTQGTCSASQASTKPSKELKHRHRAGSCAISGPCQHRP